MKSCHFEIGSPRLNYALMRILALDHGSRRIGVAVSDETRTIAQPLEFISAEPFAGLSGTI